MEHQIVELKHKNMITKVENDRRNIMNLGSKKLLCAGICFIAATVFVLAGKADFYGWAEFTKWIFGIYAAGNVGEHAANKVNVTPAGE